MTAPSLSVILPNFNHAHYLRGALPAILEQSFPCRELIVVDDGSTDDSVAVVEALAAAHPEIRLVKSPRNEGVVAALEKGWALATGEYVCLPAADDLLLPGLFEKAMRLLSEHPSAGLCVCDVLTEDGSGKRGLSRRRLCKDARYIPPAELVELMRRRTVYLSGLGSIFRKQVLEETGFLPELKWSSDRIYSTVAALRHGLCCLPEPLAVFRLRGDSYSAAGLSDLKAHGEVMGRALDLLGGEAYADVLPVFRRSSALASFEMPLLFFLAFRPGYLRFLTPN
ncbi:MAG TPA: glycosyltransferase family 2 protein, partial [Elusimicrobiales bacterium]|nr:glycosyltransferase family 2 protein [Elusimicrobiales bacterium]